MKLLMIAEHNNTVLKPINAHVLTAASHLNADIDLLIIGDQCKTVAQQAALFPSLQRVLLAEDFVYAHHLAENSAALIASLAKSYDYILCGATTFGKNVLPRVAAILDMAMVGDVTHIVSADTFVRSLYAGNVAATIQSQEPIKLLSIRPTAFAAAEPIKTPKAVIETIDKVIPNTVTQFEKEVLTQSPRPELTAARTIVSGGRGLKSQANFELIDKLADTLGAAVGATRAAVDAGFVPNDYQVGQTGKIVAPDLYIAIGISGAIQHLAGMKDSKLVVAINNDPDAPIFQSADFVLVGDLFELVPALTAALAKR